jgi:hypothetical protein
MKPPTPTGSVALTDFLPNGEQVDAIYRRLTSVGHDEWLLSCLIHGTAVKLAKLTFPYRAEIVPLGGVDALSFRTQL